MKSTILVAAIASMVLACGRRVERAWFDAPPPKKQSVQSFATPLPESAFHVRWSPVEFPAEIEPGRQSAVHLTFTNIGDQVWPDRKTAEPQATGAWAVRLGYSWVPASKPTAPPNRSVDRTDLEKPLAPGQSATLPIIVRAPDEPGDYLLNFELLQEKVVWFADQGADMLTVPVRVRAAAPATPPAPR